MSSGVALPTLDLVAPSVAFPQPLPAADVYAVPHTGAAQLGDAASEASTQMSEAVAHGLREAGEAAVEVLGALSGALLAGRAAMLTTRVLASAAVRAAEEQRCLERQEELSAAAAEQWQAAAYAVARANARRTALLARCARDTGAPGDGGPSRPDLPPPLDPVGRPLGEVRAELARLEEALRRAEERRTAWEVARLTAVLDGAAEGDDAWRRLVADRREAMVRRHTASRTAEAERDEAGPGEPPRPTADATADPEAVRALGADILAALDPAAASATVELAVGAVGRAVGRAALDPARARRHLVEARKFVQDANRTARRRRADEEWAAAQLDFLTRRAPEDTEALDEAPDAVGPLRRLLAEGCRSAPGSGGRWSCASRSGWPTWRPCTCRPSAPTPSANSRSGSAARPTRAAPRARICGWTGHRTAGAPTTGCGRPWSAAPCASRPCTAADRANAGRGNGPWTTRGAPRPRSAWRSSPRSPGSWA